MPYRMFDSVVPANLPLDGDAYLGYVDGRWPDYLAVARLAGGRPCFGLSVVGNPGAAGAGGGDFEPGDADVAAIPALVRGLHARGVARPIVYCPRSWAVAAHNVCGSAGIPRSSYRLLTAHWGAGPHICGYSCGLPFSADGTQWIDRGPYDESLLSDSFLDLPLSVTAPESAAMPQLARPVVAVVTRPQGGYWQVAQDGGTANWGGAPELLFDQGKLGELLSAGHLITDADCTPDGAGLIATGSDGGIFTAGTAAFAGAWSATESPSSEPLEA